MAIDGSKFKAVNNRDKNYTQRKIKARIEQVEDSIARYLEELDRADRQPELTTRSRIEHIKQKIVSFKRQIVEFNALADRLQKVPDQQISETDPDARSMATSGRGTGMVGYNVQTAVDTRYHLIVAHEVTNVGHDRSQLADMTRRVQQITGKKEVVAIADRGYFSGVEILACEQQGGIPLVPKSSTSNNRARDCSTSATLATLRKVMNTCARQDSEHLGASELWNVARYSTSIGLRRVPPVQ